MIRYTSSAQISLEGFAPFCEQLDENNRWIQLGKRLPWDEWAGIYHRALSVEQGRPAVDARRVIGATIIKHKLGLDDRGTIAMIAEHPYMQWFCGLSAFTSEPLFDPSLFVTLRKRMGAVVFDHMQQAILASVATHTQPGAGNNAKGRKQDKNRDQDQDQPTHKGVLKIDATIAP